MSSPVGKTLYRSLLREAGRLPFESSSLFYKNKVRAAFRAGLEGPSDDPFKELKMYQKILRQLQAANDGYRHSLARAFELGYGLRGLSRREMIEVFSERAGPKVDYSTVVVESTVLPLFQPAMIELMRCRAARTDIKPLEAYALKTSYILPEQAYDPNCVKAKIRGLLRANRINAITGRFRRTQLEKTNPPICVDVVIKEENGATRTVRPETDFKLHESLLKQAGLNVYKFYKYYGTTHYQIRKKLEELCRYSNGEVTRGYDQSEKRVMHRNLKHVKWGTPKNYKPRFLRRFVEFYLHARISVMTIIGDPKGKLLRISVTPCLKGKERKLNGFTEEDKWWMNQNNAVRI